MGKRIIEAVGELLLEFESKMITFMIWLCWICGITSDEVERCRDEQNRSLGSASLTNNPQTPPDRQQPTTTSR